MASRTSRTSAAGLARLRMSARGERRAQKREMRAEHPNVSSQIGKLCGCNPRIGLLLRDAVTRLGRCHGPPRAGRVTALLATSLHVVVHVAQRVPPPWIVSSLSALRSRRLQCMISSLCTIRYKHSVGRMDFTNATRRPRMSCSMLARWKRKSGRRPTTSHGACVCCMRGAGTHADHQGCELYINAGDCARVSCQLLTPASCDSCPCSQNLQLVRARDRLLMAVLTSVAKTSTRSCRASTPVSWRRRRSSGDRSTKFVSVCVTAQAVADMPADQALQLLEYLVKNGSERVVDDARSHIATIKMLRNFYYIDEKGKDQGLNGKPSVVIGLHIPTCMQCVTARRSWSSCSVMSTKSALSGARPKPTRASTLVWAATAA